jgi:VCBS repeat-containing protein
MDDAYETDEELQLNIAVAQGVLINDSDVDGDALTAILVDNVSHGTLTLNANGSFTYTPTANYFGEDSFTYKAKDAALESNLATVTITVTNLKDQVVAVDDQYTVAEDATLTVAAPGVLAK